MSIFSRLSEVISPTIISKISLKVMRPSISPYSSTIKPTRLFSNWKLANCVFKGVFSGINSGSSTKVFNNVLLGFSKLRKSAFLFELKNPIILSIVSL